MCRPTAVSASRAPPRKKHSLLLTAESFNFDDNREDKDDSNKKHRWNGPTVLSTVMTTAVLCGMFLAIELGLREVLERYQSFHPLLENETNRHVLARHVGVDALGCVFVAVLGYTNRHVMSDLINTALGHSDSMHKHEYENRLFTYHPEGQRVLVFFFAYQVKNLIDSYLWEDGIVYLLHHILAGGAAWGGMHPGTCHFYALFYMGMSEVSTAVLCLLANFDDEHGVVGLGEAFPLAKAALGVSFVLLFLLCRVVLWPYVTYHFLNDVKTALKSDEDSERMEGRRGWIKFIAMACSGLTVIQLVFLWMIVVIAKEEIGAFLA